MIRMIKLILFEKFQASKNKLSSSTTTTTVILILSKKKSWKFVLTNKITFFLLGACLARKKNYLLMFCRQGGTFENETPAQCKISQVQSNCWMLNKHKTKRRIPPPPKKWKKKFLVVEFKMNFWISNFSFFWLSSIKNLDIFFSTVIKFN